MRDSHAERIRQAGEKVAVVEHDDGSKFRVDFENGVPEKLKGSPTPPRTRELFHGLDFSKDGKVIKEEK